jgi:membrane protein
MLGLNVTYQEFLKLDFKDAFWRLYKKAFDEEDIISNSAQVAFYFTFALFPLLLFLISLFGLILISADDMRAELFLYLRRVMPGSAYELVEKTIAEVTDNSSGGKITLGIFAALWAASAGIDSIRVALNGIYNLTETRPWWKTKLLTLSLTLGLAVLLTIALGVIFYGGKFISLILGSLSFSISSPFFLGVLQIVTVLAVLITIFAIIYNFLPKHKKYKWVWVTPGAIVGIVLWLLLSYGFRLYLGYFNSYDKTYGSLGAVIILMLWLYLTALVILIGGTLNAVLQEFTDPETAKAGERKAAAKEAVENPDEALSKDKPKSDTRIPKDLVQKGDDKSQAEDEKSLKENEDTIAENKPEVKRSKFKLIAGLVIGFFSSLKKR